MKKHIFAILSSVMLLLCNSSMGQTPELNLKKYWHYRYRLINYFMSVGAKQGQSLPATARNGGNREGLVDGDIQWVDASGRDLGWYIATLATEYKLLKLNNATPIELNETIRELYYALHAVYRVDSIGVMTYVNIEHLIDGAAFPSTPPIFPGSGYLYRDDVPSNFLTLHPQFAAGDPNFPSSPYSGFAENGDGKVGPVNYIASDYRDVIDDNKPHEADNSIDNYCQLLMGLALVVKLVDPGISSFTDGTVSETIPATYGGDLEGMAKQEGVAILKYIFNWSGYSLSLGSYDIVSPDGTLVTDGKGGGATPFVLPLSELGSSIFSTSFSIGSDDPGIDDSYNWPEYSLCNILVPIKCSNPEIQNIELGCVCAALSNDGGPAGGIGAGYSLIEELGNYTSTSCLLCHHPPENDFGWDQCYGSILALLHPGAVNIGSSINLCSIENMLNLAPYDGPFCHIPNTDAGSDYATSDWASARRFMEGKQAITGGDDGNRGNYNGLDYMLLYNLYCMMSYLQRTTNPYVTVNDAGNTFGVGELNVLNPPDIYPFTFFSFMPSPNFTPEGYIGSPYTIYSPNCTPIVIQKLNVNTDTTVYTGFGTPRPQVASGSLLVTGSLYSYIDFKPTQGNIIIQNGSFLDARCTLTCCEANPAGYVYQPDPGADSDFREVSPKDDTTTYKMTGAFDSLVKSGNNLVCYPNPFSTETIIDFTLSKSGPVHLYITNLQGKVLSNLISTNLYSQGEHVITYAGEQLPLGGYLCVFDYKTGRKTIKLLKTK